MTERDQERSRRYARQSSLISRLVYAPLARKVAGILPSTESAPTIVDLGCGSGQLAIRLGRLRRHARLVGVDPSVEMLRIARENASRAGLLNFEARQGSAEEVPIESGSVDLVVSQSSFHEWENPQKGLTEILRILRPGGCLILKDYNLGWLSGWKRPLLGRLHPLHMFKFGVQEVTALSREAGFDRIEVRSSGLQYLVCAYKRMEGEVR